MSIWKTFKINANPYLFKLKETDSIYTCFVSDFKSIWSESLNKQELLDRAKDKVNRFIDIGDWIFDILNGLPPPQKADDIKIHELDQNRIELDLQYNRNGKIPFTFCWRLTQQSSQVLYDEVIMPLLQHIVNVEREMDSLNKAIKQKDDEIKQLNGGTVPRRKNISNGADHANGGNGVVSFIDCSLASFLGDDRLAPVIESYLSNTMVDVNAADSAIMSAKQKQMQSTRKLLHEKTVKPTFEHTDSQESEEGNPLSVDSSAVCVEPLTQNDDTSDSSSIKPRKVPKLNI